MTSFRELFLAGICILTLVLAAGCTQPANEPGRTDAYTLSITKTATGAAPDLSPTPATTASMEAWKRARLETSMGNITIALDPAMPVTAGNFEALVLKGYYNSVIFHRVIDGFMIQGGDPTGTGHGGPGYTIKDEFSSHNKNSRGAVAMANTGQRNSGGSQFFINLVDNSPLQSNTF